MESAVKLVDASSKNPLAVGVVVVLIALFGWISMRKLPLQLFPDIDRPQISVETGWRAASPEEVESELLEPQERVLQGLPGLEEMQGTRPVAAAPSASPTRSVPT